MNLVKNCSVIFTSGKENIFKNQNILHYLSMKYIYLILFTLLTFSCFSQDYKYMMNDRSHNVYDVIEEAEKYFSSIDRTAKGSGWMGFQRWVNRIEPRYYPSGDRELENPRKVENAYQVLKKKHSQSENRDNDLGWIDLGPYTANNISEHYSPGIGRVEQVWVEPINKQLMYLSSRSGGFWRSANGGMTWENTTDQLPSSGVDVFSVNPNNINDILINVRNSSNGVTMGVYRSLDGGTTWNTTSFSPSNTGIGGLGTNDYVFDIKFSPHNSNHIYIAASGFLYRSTDGLASIQVVSDNSYLSIEFHQTNPNIVFAPRSYYWARNEIWRSTNGGSNWSLLHNINENNHRGFTVATTPADPNLVLFSSNTYIWKSTDNGVTIDTIPGSSGKGSYFEVSPTDANIMINGDIDIRMSYDGGNNWNTVTDWFWSEGGTPLDDYVHADIRYATFSGGDIYCGTDGYMVKSPDDGATWSILSDGTSLREYYKLGVSQSDNDIVVCGSQDNGTSIYKGQDQPWLEWIGADGMEALVHPLDADRMIGSIQFGSKKRSINGGLSSTAINDHPNIGDLQWEAPVLYDPMDQMKLFTVGQTLYSSDDFGTTWTPLQVFDEGSFQHLAKSENDQEIILASKNEKLYRSINQGSSFARVGNGTFPTKSIQDIAFDPNDDNNVVVVFAHYEDYIPRIFRSMDAGQTWSDITYNLNAMPIKSVVIDHTDQKNIYLGAEIGIYKMSWSDTEYELWSDNLPSTTIEELEIVYSSNTLRAATWGRGLWERCLDGRENHPKITKVEVNTPISETLPCENQDVNLVADVEYGDNISSMFITYAIDDIDLQDTVYMTLQSKNKFIIDGYMPKGAAGELLHFKVFAVDLENDTTTTYRYNYTYREEPTSACVAEGGNNTGGNYINLVAMNGVSKSSNQDYYADFTEMTFNLAKFETYELEVGLQYSFAADTTFAWVDWDNSFSFDEDELIIFTSFDSNHKSYGQLKVPDNINANNMYTMRVRSQWSSSNPEPCGTITGEVEDYTLLISEGCAKGYKVTNLNNEDKGSLRYLIENTCAGDTIFISNTLENDTLQINNDQIDIKSDLTIIGLDNLGFTISGNSENRIFKIEPGITLSLHNLRLIDGEDNPNGGAIHNLGNLILTDVEFKNNTESGQAKAFSNDGIITIKMGETSIKE